MSSLADQLVREARRGGVSEADLVDAYNRLDDPAHGRTVAEHADIAMSRLNDGTRRTYKTYVSRFVDKFGERRVVDITFRDLEAFAAEIMKNRTKRRNTHDDRLPENCVGALRNMFTLAVKHGIRSDNPATDLKKPKRTSKEPREAVDRNELVELVNVSRRDSNDADLDLLIMRFVSETGCRRQGVLNLTVNDIDVSANKVRLNEKGGTVRWQNITAELIVEIFAHMNSRPTAAGVDQVFRQQPRGTQQFHQPITRKRFEALTGFWQDGLLWAKQRGVSLHWLRHTAITNIDRIAGFAVAEAFAGHEPQGVTARYTTARPDEVLDAFNIYVGLTPSDDDKFVLPMHIFRSTSISLEAQVTPGTGCTERETTKNRLHASFSVLA